MKIYDAVIAGYICVDLIPQFRQQEGINTIKEMMRPGRLIELDGMEITLGGLVPNTGLAMLRFSNKVYLNGLLGKDILGGIVEGRLSEYNILTGIENESNSGTAFGIVIAPPGIDRIFLESPGSNEFFAIHHVDFNVVAQSRLFHFGYPPLLKQFYKDDGIQLYEMFARIDRMGVLTSLDFSLPDPNGESGRINWRKILKKTLPHVDIFVPSLEEATQIIMPGVYAEIFANAGQDENIIDLIPLDVIRKIGAELIEMGVKVALLKSGHKGLYLWTGDVSSLNRKADIALDPCDWNNKCLWIPAYPADESKIKNASGAGDTASAAFFTAILNSETVSRSLNYAAIAGRNNLYCNDIYTELSDWAEMTGEIQNTAHSIVDLALSKSTSGLGIENR